eukprot:gb/GFBE01021340.1/.p1 GENE.gb/GFBE01021340.1/~~gb/GFBE01021340.1/.p1  ORF type:complete len:449 (+),score=82.96 gb/GFBE01021340.1/:1-1347(+)
MAEAPEDSSDLDLAQYLNEQYIQDEPLSIDVVKSLLSQTPNGIIDWSGTAGEDDTMPPLHYAVMNEATPAEEMFDCISTLLQHRADPTIKDEDGDTALEAVLSLASAQDESEEAQGDSDMPKQCWAAAAGALIRSPQQPVGDAEANALCSWLRLHMPKDLQSKVLTDLEKRIGRREAEKYWSSQKLLKYFEECAYDKKKGLSAEKVQRFLEDGASPSASQHGATALLLAVLNPYSTYGELSKMFRIMLQKEPAVITRRDGFNLSPFHWASDYDNVAKQHRVKPNAAILLALTEAIAEFVPPELDAAESCLKIVSPERCAVGPGQRGKVLRFLEGDRVVCKVEAPGNSCAWEEGVVVGLWYKDTVWPAEFPGAPYEVKLDIGHLVYALLDDDRMIRREESKAAAAASRASPPAGGRFQKQQRADGSWELLDTRSGKARPCSPPDSDDDD